MQAMKRVGNIGEAKAIAWFVEHGISVSIPFGDNERYDLVIDYNGKLEKVQVKTSSYCPNSGCISFKLHSSTYHTSNKQNRAYENDVDSFVLCDLINDSLYYVPISQVIGKKNINIRFANSNNGQMKNCIFANDVEITKYFKDNVCA